MAVHPIVVKAIVKVATDKRTWKLIAILIAAFLTRKVVLQAETFKNEQVANYLKK